MQVILMFLFDAERLVYEFYDDIAASMLATYFCALVFMPRKTRFYESYFPSAQQQLKLPQVMSGTAEVWDACLSTTVTKRPHRWDGHVAVSPCSKEPIGYGNCWILLSHVRAQNLLRYLS